MLYYIFVKFMRLLGTQWMILLLTNYFQPPLFNHIGINYLHPILLSLFISKSMG